MRHTRIIVTHYGGPDAPQVVEDLERAGEKVVGEPYEGKSQVRFEVAGDGNLDEESQAPSPDPNSGLAGRSPLNLCVRPPEVAIHSKGGRLGNSCDI